MYFDSINTAKIKVSNKDVIFDNRIIVNQDNHATILGGTIDSTKEYFIDGQIDMGTTEITVPSGGINISGFNFNLSGLYSTEDNYTLLKGATAGDILFSDFYIDISGANSKVYDLTSNTGFNAVEVARINYNNCTSLGELINYRQGLEDGTGRFGGTPTLTLTGTWVGGFFTSTSIVRNLDAGMTTSLFKAGAAFVMNSRFFNNMNLDIPVGASFCDFTLSNFPNANTLQIQGSIMSMGGVFDAETNTPLLFPNIDHTELPSFFKNNIGIDNTFVGANMLNFLQTTTPITVQNQYEQVNGSWGLLGAEHFDDPNGGTPRHLAGSPREFEITGSLVFEGGANDEISIRFTKWDDSDGAFEDLLYTQQLRKIDNLIGARNVAYFTIDLGVTLDKNDYLILKVANTSGTDDVELEADSFFRVQER